MRGSRGAASLLLTALALVSPTRLFDETAGAQSAPTFNHDVALILFARCVTCHRPGEVAPMSLLTFEQAKAHADDIRTMVEARQMPPWPADPHVGEFKSNRRLSDEQVRTIVAWVQAGAPQGDGVPPSAPVFREGWSSRMDRPPDLVLETPFTFDLPASGIVPTFAIWLKLPIREEQYIQAVELRPDNRHAVHHSSLTVGPLPEGTRLGRAAVWDGGLVLDGVPVYPDGRPFRAMSAEAFGKPLLFYVPGGGVLQFPDGLAKRISPDQYLAWGLLLMTPGPPEKVKLHVGLWYAKGPPHHEIYTWTVNERLVANGVEVPR